VLPIVCDWLRTLRPIISGDGTFLSGNYKGALMVSIGMTTENQLLLLSFALVKSENNES
jgi:hypothetical protein